MPFLVVFMSVCLIALTLSLYKSIEFFQKKNDKNLMQFLNQFQFKTKQTARRNCIDENHFCEQTTDCSNICQSGLVPIHCNHNTLTCEPYKIEESEPEEVKENPCNQKHGFIYALNVNILWDDKKNVEWVCINTLPKLFNDKDELNSFVCESGQFSVDVNNGLSRAVDCKCNSELNLVVAVHQNDNIVPRCISRSLLPLLPSFIWLYT